MERAIDRIEGRLDDQEDPVWVIGELPAATELDTRALANGAHQLRVRTVLSDGEQHERRISFQVNNAPEVSIEGLADGAIVSGAVEVRLVSTGGAAASTRSGIPAWAFALGTLAILGGIWAVAALTPASGELATRVATATAPAGAAAPAAPGSGAATSPAAGAAQLRQEGAAVYAQKCASCHQPGGQGVPGTFPPLAGNPRLADAGLVIDSVLRGKAGKITVKGQTYNGNMPPVPGLSEAQVAAVASYVRNTWGNSYGDVTVAQVQAQH